MTAINPETANVAPATVSCTYMLSFHTRRQPALNNGRRPTVGARMALTPASKLPLKKPRRNTTTISRRGKQLAPFAAGMVAATTAAASIRAGPAVAATILAVRGRARRARFAPKQINK